MIEIKKLTKVFPSGQRAVDQLDLQIHEGEILGLLGPNGAGKTTIVRVLSTLCGFDEGQVFVNGFDVDRDAEQIRRSIGYVAQQTGVDFLLTGRENLQLIGRLYHMKKADIADRIDELVRYFDLNEYIDRTVRTYSGGVRRKLDIATALIHRPKVLYLDEPTLGLDIHSRQNLWQFITKLNQEQGLTILLTTHYLEEADQLAHRVAIIHQGKIVACDTPQILRAHIPGEAVTLSFNTKDSQVKAFANSLLTLATVKDHIWQNESLHLYVQQGTDAITKIVQAATTQDIQIKTISLSKPSLDDVFLKFTGTRMTQGEEQQAEPWWQQWAGKGGGKWGKQWQQTSETTDGSENIDQAADTSTTPSDQDWKKWQAQDSAPSDAKADNDAAADSKPSDESAPTQEGWKKWQNQAGTSANRGENKNWPASESNERQNKSK